MKYWGKFKLIFGKLIRNEWFHVPLLLAILIGGFFSRDLYIGKSLTLNTFSEPTGTLLVYPWDRVSSEAIHNGHFPLWNPYNALGVPHWANIQTACLFPLKLIIYFFPSLFLNDLYILLRLFLGGLFIYLFIRSLGLSKECSIFSAIAYPLWGGEIYNINCSGTNTYIILPLSLYLFKNLTERPTVCYILLCSLAVSLSIFGGNPGSSFYCLFFTLLFYLFQVFIISRKKGIALLESLLLGVIVLIIGLVISTIQIIPFAEFLKRSWSFHPDWVGFIHYPIKQIFALLIPEFERIYFFSMDNLKAVFSGNWYSVWEAWRSPYESTSVSMGMVPLGLITSVFAIYGIFILKRLPRYAVFFAGSLSILMGLIFGLPIFNLIGFFPVFNISHNFIHAFHILIFPFLVLGTLGLESLLKRRHSSRRFQAVTVGTIFVLIGYILINWHKLTQFNNFLRDFFHSIFLAILFLLAVLLLFNLFRKRIIGRKLFAGLIMLLAYLNFNLFYNYLQNEDNFNLGLTKMSESPSVKFLNKDSDIFRINSLPGIFLPNLGILFNLSELRSHSGLFFNRYAKIINLINDFSEEEGRKYYLFGYYKRLRPEKIYFPLIDLFNIKYILSPTTLYPGILINDIISEGEILSSLESGVRESLFKISGKERTVLYQHPLSIIDYSLPVIKNDSSLRFALTLDSSVWEPTRGDGVHFEIRVEEKGKERLIYSKYIDPKNHLEDRGWCEAELDLTSFQDKYITLKFITDPGPCGNYDSDWAGWGDLRIERKGREDESRFELVFDGDIKVYHNRQVLPRAFVINQTEVIEDEEKILTRLGSKKFNFREEVILEEDIPELMSVSRSPANNSMAEIVDYQANRVEIEAMMDRKGFLVLSDTYYPGWRVWVDGREEKIYRADYLLRAVHLSPGFHQVKFVFDPLSFKLGLWMALGTIVCLGGFFAYSKFGKKK